LTRRQRPIGPRSTIAAFDRLGCYGEKERSRGEAVHDREQRTAGAGTGPEHGRTIPLPDIGAVAAHHARGLSGDGKAGAAEALRGRRIGLAGFLEQFGLLLILERSSSCMWYEA
jgi:hypothetical protein